MNNEIKEYNSGGLLNTPVTFNGNPVDMTTLLNLFTPPPGYGFGSFSIPKEKIIDLVAEHEVDTITLMDTDPANMEEYIHDKLARELAKKLIEEDLIQIQSYRDTETMNTTFRAKVKIVQE